MSSFAVSYAVTRRVAYRPGRPLLSGGVVVPDVAPYTIVLDKGTFGLTGNDMNIVVTTVPLALDTGAFVLAGTDTGINYSGSVTDYTATYLSHLQY